MHKRLISYSLALFFVALSAHAGHYADTYVIPVAGHVTGANGTMWMTDIAIRNFRTTPLEVQLVVIESGYQTSDNVYPLSTSGTNGSVTIPANGTVVLKDVLREHRGMTNVSGAIVLGASAPFAVTSRTYSSGMAVGQTVDAERDFFDNALENADNASFAYVPGIMSNTMARTNIGFAAGAGPGAPMTIEMSVRGANGSSLGARSITVPAGQFMQLQIPVGSLTNATIDAGSVDFRIVSGEGIVIPYASIVDNATGGAAYVAGLFPETTAATGASRSTSSLFRTLVEGTDR